MVHNFIDYIGLVAGTLTTISFLPQAIQAIKSKDTKSISLSMYILFTIGISLWLVYGFAINSLPLKLCNGITLILAVLILKIKIKYG